MTGDPQEAIETAALARADSVTLAAGHQIPRDFRLVTREVLMWDQTGKRYPALIQMIEDTQSELIELGYTTETRLPIRWIVYFEAEGSEPTGRTANRYRSPLIRALMSDIYFGGLATYAQIDTTPIPLLMREGMATTVFEMTLRFVVTYIYDPRDQPISV
jgi:hypothetical protein